MVLGALPPSCCSCLTYILEPARALDAATRSFAGLAAELTEEGIQGSPVVRQVIVLDQARSACGRCGAPLMNQDTSVFRIG